MYLIVEEDNETNMDGCEEEAMDVDQDDSLHDDDDKEDEQGKETSELDDETENSKEDKQDGGEEPKDDDVEDDEDWRTKHESEVSRLRSSLIVLEPLNESSLGEISFPLRFFYGYKFLVGSRCCTGFRRYHSK
jgi:hypothetical protein